MHLIPKKIFLSPQGVERELLVKPTLIEIG